MHGNRGKKLDDLFAKKFLGKDFGVIQKGKYRGKSAEWIDWFGNLEASPPVKVKGKEFRNGRIYVGTQGERSMHPDVVKFLEAQGAQAPVLWIDTSWLVIGHVDETVSWVPVQAGHAVSNVDTVAAARRRNFKESRERRAGRHSEPGHEARARPARRIRTAGGRRIE